MKKMKTLTIQEKSFEVVDGEARTKIAALTEEIAKLPQGGGAQSDWAVNDESDPAYVKNRTHYENPPKFDIRWDGDMSDRLAIPMDMFGMPGMYLVKCSDIVLEVDDMYGARYKYNQYSGYFEITTIDSESMPGTHVLEDMRIVIVYDSETLSAAVGLPTGYITDGVYFRAIPSENWYVNAFYFPGEIEKLDIKYLPDEVTTGAVRYDGYMFLKEEQKTMARYNIDAAKDEDIIGKLSFLDLIGGVVSNGTFFNQKMNSVKNDIFTQIEYNGFGSCTNLNLVDLPKLTSIGSRAFADCIALTKFIMRKSDGVVGLESNDAFSGTPLSLGNNGGYFYVPAALVTQYKSDDRWVDFVGRFRALEDYTVDGTITGDLDESKI